MKILKRLLLVFLLLAVVAIALFTHLLFKNRESYIVDQGAFGSLASRVDENLKIAIIGDSWAAGQKLDEALASELQSLGLSPVIVSYGHPGGKSRDVLHDLCERDNVAEFLSDHDIDIFIVMVGVNDSKGHDGADFYQFHVDQLLRLVTSHGSLAVVLDVPKYGVEAFDAPTLQHWCKRQASRFLFDSGKRDNRPEYRSRLKKLSDEIPNVALVEAARLPSYDDDRDLWRDPAHLNSSGYQVAAKPVAAEINRIYQIKLAQNNQEGEQDGGGQPATRPESK
jgi:lysophospholipase L1-like esterase